MDTPEPSGTNPESVHMGTQSAPKRRGRPKGSTKAQATARRNELNARQRSFVLWSATHESYREPKTRTELAEILGVSPTMLWKWSKDPRIVEAIRFVALQNAGDPVKVRAIVDMLYDVALAKRDVRTAEVWLKATGVFSQFGRTGDLLEIPEDAEVDSFENYSLEELQRLRDEALAANLEQVTLELAQRKLASSHEREAAEAASYADLEPVQHTHPDMSSHSALEQPYSDANPDLGPQDQIDPS